MPKSGKIRNFEAVRFIKTLKQPKPLDLPALLRKKSAIARLCKGHNIILLYLFGSAARGKMGPLSDVDVAYLPSKNLTLSAEMKLIEKLCDLFEREDMDAVNLAAAAPLLAHEVIAKGKLLFFASVKDRVSFEYRAQREYFDTIPLRNTQFQYLKRRIMTGNFGRGKQ